jgi:exodeoxyribonuclease-3
MKIVSWNVNGIRAAERKGFLDWLARSDADIVLLQEIKANEEQLSDELRAPRGWFTAFHSAQKPGYSGVAAYCRETPDEVAAGLAESRFDDEGRVLSVRFGDLHVIGAYFPNGSRDCSRVPFKLDFYSSILAHANRLREQGLKVVICGDWNTAHEEIDLARPKDNHRTTGFLPEEREWVTKFLSHGWADAWRRRNPGVGERYSWWAPWQFARRKNIGWRIDFHVVDEAMLGGVADAGIHEDVLGSDHCPVSLHVVEGRTTRVPVTSSGASSASSSAKPSSSQPAAEPPRASSTQAATPTSMPTPAPKPPKAPKRATASAKPSAPKKAPRRT